MHKHLEDIPVVKNVRGKDFRVLVDHEHALVKQLILGPDESIPEHKVPVDVTFFVLEGRGVITIDKTSYEVRQHSVVTCPKDTGMSVRAKADTFSFLNIKTPAFKVKA